MIASTGEEDFVFSAFKWSVHDDRFQILLWIVVQNQIGVFQRCVVDQSLQLRPFIHIDDDFVFHNDGVNGKHTAVH